MSYSINSLQTIYINDMDLFNGTKTKNQEQHPTDEEKSAKIEERINQQQRMIET
jgi:hypothetical protein